MADERSRAWRQLEALTVAARNHREAARGAADRAEVLARCAARVEAWREEAGEVDDAPARLRGLPDPPTARILAATFERAEDSWDAVTRRARDLAEDAERDAEERRAKAEHTERMREEAEARVRALGG
ncbi:MAG: hypothetical protein ACQEXJ_02495 [Myxococcota bacterium]